MQFCGLINITLRQNYLSLHKISHNEKRSYEKH
jgi:hypothetical protein